MSARRNGDNEGKGPTLAPPRPSAGGSKAPPRPAPKVVAEDPYDKTVADAPALGVAVAAIVAEAKAAKAAPAKPSTPPPVPKAAPSSKPAAPKPASLPAKAGRDALSGADDADTAVTMSEPMTSALAELTARSAARARPAPSASTPPPARKTLAPPPPPASSRPAASAAPAVAKPATLPPPPPSSRPSRPSPPAVLPSPVAMISAPPPSSRPSRFEGGPSAFAPVVQVAPPATPTLKGFGPGGAPLAPPSSHPAPLAPPPPPSTPAPMTRMPMTSTPKAFAPLSSGPVPAVAPAAHVAYERAFRAWSSSTVAREPDPAEGPLSYQVYTPSDLAAPRPVSLSRLAEETALSQPKASVASRFALVAAGLLTVLATASVISFASSDDAPRAAAANAIGRSASTTLAPPGAPTLPASSTTTTSVDVPAPRAVVVVEAPKPAAPVVAPKAVPVAAPQAAPVVAFAALAPAKPKPAAPAKPSATLAADPWAPGSPTASSTLRTQAPPPNPYGGTPSSVLRPPPGFKR